MAGKTEEDETEPGRKKSRLDEMMDAFEGGGRLSDLLLSTDAITQMELLRRQQEDLERTLLRVAEGADHLKVPEFSYFDIPFPIPDSYELRDEPAKDFYDALQKEYAKQAARLGPDEQLVILHYDAAGTPTDVRKFSYRSPALLVLYGENRTVIANVNSLQLVLGVIKVEPENKREIGFLIP